MSEPKQEPSKELVNEKPSEPVKKQEMSVIKFVKLVSGESIIAILRIADMENNVFLFENPAKVLSQIVSSEEDVNINYFLTPYIELSKTNTISLSLKNVSNISTPSDNALLMYKDFLKNLLKSSNETKSVAELKKDIEKDIVYENKEHPFFTGSRWVNFVEDQNQSVH